MKLNEFLKQVNGKESDIINYDGEVALRNVKKYGDALKYVNNQTEEICLEAVKKHGCALQYVNKSIFDKVHTITLDGKEIEISEESYQAFKDQFKEE